MKPAAAGTDGASIAAKPYKEGVVKGKFDAVRSA